MSTRRFSLLVGIALALGLTLGGVGSATASALSKGTVRKIAAKVVKKKARSLSVAHAATADSAATAATAAVADRARGQVFTLPTQLNALARDYTFPGLAAGSYLASFALAANIPSGSTFTCQFQPATGPTVAPSYQTATNNFATADGTSIVTVAAGFRLSCNGSSPFGVNPYYGATVSFVPVVAGAPTEAVDG
jgi:hypothetical protein